MTFVGTIDLCLSCQCNVPQPKDEDGIIDFLDPSTLTIKCIFGEEKEAKRQQGRVVECDKYAKDFGALKISCCICKTEFYIYFDYDDDTNRIDITEDKCPGCHANLRIQIRQEVFPSTLKQWKETGEMTEKMKKTGLHVYPGGTKRQHIAIMGRNRFRDFPESLGLEKVIEHENKEHGRMKE